MATTTRTRRSAETSAVADTVTGQPPAARPAAKKAPARKTAAPAPAPAVAEAAAPAPAPAKKAAARKTAAAPAAKAPAAKKAAASQPATVETPAKPAAKKAAAKKAAAKKTAAKAPPAAEALPVTEKPPAPKPRSAAKKTAAKQPAAKKTAASEPAAQKTAAKTDSPRKAPAAPAPSVDTPVRAPEAAPASPAPATTGGGSGRSKKPPAKVEAPRAAPKPAPAPPQPPARFTWQRPEADEVFAPIALRDRRDGREYTLELRSATPGDNRCSCGAWRDALSGQCEHLEFALDELAADSDTEAVLDHGWQPLHSEVYLRYGARRSLRWLAGSICPEPLDEAALALLDERGELRADDGTALPALLRLAQEVGQELRIADDVWTHLAHRRDAANRVRRLEQAYPEGTASPALHALLTLPLRPYQVEGALFAAVAGHALLADEDGLGKTVQAVAATELLLRHFGVERVLVACAPEQAPHWQEALQSLAGRGVQPVQGSAAERAALYADAAPIKLADLGRLREDAAGIAAFQPELLIVDEARDDGQPLDFGLLDGVAAPYALLITRAPLEERPQDLLPRVLWLDPYRLGTSARFLRQHLRHDAAGEILGVVGLETLDTTLRHLMLRRSREDVADQLPESVDVPWPVALTTAQRSRHDEAAAPAGPILARWHRSAYVSDADQHRLVATLRQMQALCQDGGGEAQPKLDALLALLPELLARPDTRVVVFSARTQTALQAGRRLGAAGIDHVVFGASDASRRRLQDSAAYRVVLCSDDAGSEALPPQPLKSVVVQLDPPCDPLRRERRLQRVQGGAPARNLPVVQLIAQDSLEAALWALPRETRELVASALEGQGGPAFLQGEPLARFMAATASLLQGLTAPR